MLRRDWIQVRLGRGQHHLSTRRHLASALNTGTEPCRFVALHASRAVQREEGGIEQIDFENEEQNLRALYEAECAKNGVSVQMDDQ